MLVSLPYCYSHDYFLKGGAKRASRVLTDTIDGEVPETTSAQAPYALKWLQASRNPRQEPVPQGVRFHEGAFYAPGNRERTSSASQFRASSLSAPGDAAAADNLCGLHGYDLQSQVKALAGHLEGKPATMRDQGGIAVDFGDDHREAREAARRVFEGMLVVDGEVWRRVVEPTLLINYVTDEWNRLPRKTILTSQPHYGTRCVNATVSDVGNTHLYRVTDLPAFAEVGRENDRFGINVKVAAVEIAMPDVFEFDAVRNAYGRVVGEAIASFGPDAFKWKREAVDFFLDIRRDYERYLGDDAYPVEEVADRLPELMAKIGRCTDLREMELMASLETARLNEPPISILSDAF